MDDTNILDTENALYEVEPGSGEEAMGFSSQAQKDKFLSGTPDKQKNVSENPILPKIEIDERITSPDNSYSVDVDKEGVSELLRLAGVQDTDIPKIDIRILKKQPREDRKDNGKTFGTYLDGTITLYADNIYMRFPTVAKAHRILQERGEPTRDTMISPNKNLFPELTNGNRFTAYFQVAPKERAMRMAERLQGIQAGKDADLFFAHEAKHAGNKASEQEGELNIDLETQTASGESEDRITLLGKVLRVPVIKQFAQLAQDAHYFVFDPEESSAKDFAKTIETNHQQHRMITFTPTSS